MTQSNQTSGVLSETTPPALEMRGICKSFPGVRALDGASLVVLPGEVHALMGENGAGKSTLMKILAGAYHADSGDVLLDGERVNIDSPQRALELGINIIYQEFNLVPHLSVAENIYLGREPAGPIAGLVNGRRMRVNAQQVLDSLGADLDATTPVSQLSVAQQQMVEIARSTSRRSKVIAMDEPSATLTEHELGRLWTLIRKLKGEGVSIIYISHRMTEVFNISDRVTVLRDGKTVSTSRISEIDQDELVRQMVGRKLEETFPTRNTSIGPPMLEVSGLSRKGVIEDVSFSLRKGEILALAGLVGSGRTEIARCIFGADPYDRGEIRLDGQLLHPRSPQMAIRAGIGLVTEDRKQQGLVLGMNVRENTTLASLPTLTTAGFIRSARERLVARDTVKRLGIRTPSTEQEVRNLSGGNQQKVVLGKWLFTHCRLLIMDEPTRGIDVGAKLEIYHLMNELVEEGVAILMISSELPEVLGMADRILVVRGGRVVRELPRAEATQEVIGRAAVGLGD